MTEGFLFGESKGNPSVFRKAKSTSLYKGGKNTPSFAKRNPPPFTKEAKILRLSQSEIHPKNKESEKAFPNGKVYKKNPPKRVDFFDLHRKIFLINLLYTHHTKPKLLKEPKPEEAKC